jgi:hypothetical protein
VPGQFLKGSRSREEEDKTSWFEEKKTKQKCWEFLVLKKRKEKVDRRKISQFKKIDKKQDKRV